MDTDDGLIRKLENHPRLKKRFQEILDIAENTSGELITADEAETKAIEELQKLGRELCKSGLIANINDKLRHLKRKTKLADT